MRRYFITGDDLRYKTGMSPSSRVRMPLYRFQKHVRRQRLRVLIDPLLDRFYQDHKTRSVVIAERQERVPPIAPLSRG